MGSGLSGPLTPDSGHLEQRQGCRYRSVEALDPRIDRYRGHHVDPLSDEAAQSGPFSTHDDRHRLSEEPHAKERIATAGIEAYRPHPEPAQMLDSVGDRGHQRDVEMLQRPSSSLESGGTHRGRASSRHHQTGEASRNSRPSYRPYIARILQMIKHDQGSRRSPRGRILECNRGD